MIIIIYLRILQVIVVIKVFKVSKVEAVDNNMASGEISKNVSTEIKNIKNFYVKILKNTGEKKYYTDLVKKLDNYIPTLYNANSEQDKIMITENVGKINDDNISNELYKIFDNETFLGNKNDLEYFDKGIFLLKMPYKIMFIYIFFM